MSSIYTVKFHRYDELNEIETINTVTTEDYNTALKFYNSKVNSGEDVMVELLYNGNFLNCYC